MPPTEQRQSPVPSHQTAATPHPGVAGTIDAAGWGLFFIWVGLCTLADLGWDLFFLGTGALLLAGQAARRHAGLVVDRLAVLLGVCFAVAGVARLLALRWPQAVVPGWAAPALFIALGVVILVLAWRRATRR